MIGLQGNQAIDACTSGEFGTLSSSTLGVRDVVRLSEKMGLSYFMKFEEEFVTTQLEILNVSELVPPEISYKTKQTDFEDVVYETTSIALLVIDDEHLPRMQAPAIYGFLNKEDKKPYKPADWNVNKCVSQNDDSLYVDGKEPPDLSLIHI